MPSTTFEQWKADWNAAFTPEARQSAVILQHVIPNRTFARVEMLSKSMMKVWFDLMKHNYPRLISKAQLSTRIAGPCSLFMCYFTSNHMEIGDPTSISCIVPMYIQNPHVGFQGLMRLDKTFVGLSDTEEQMALLVMASRMAPQTEPFQFIFISPVPYIGSILGQLLERKSVRFSKCKAGSLFMVSSVHVAKKCQCGLEIGDWDETDIRMDMDPPVFILPRVMYNKNTLGCVNVPWASGYSFDITKQKEGWLAEDDGVAALTEAWLAQSDFLNKHAKEISFLSILTGIDGIHIIDFPKFIKIDPLEAKDVMLASPASDQASGSKP